MKGCCRILINDQMKYGCIVLFLTHVLWASESLAQAPPVATLRIVNQFGGKPLQLNQAFLTLNGDTVVFSRFSYYLSNIRLKEKDGKEWRQPESYHYVDLSEEGVAEVVISLQGIPKGEYTEISFGVGIDSLRNHSGAQVDALDPDNGMFWMWETGYVFLKAEGFYHRAVGGRKAFVYHIGRDDCYQTVQLKLPNPLITYTKAPVLEITADARQLFGGYPAAAIQLKAPVKDESASVMGGAKAIKVALNYTRMFSLRKGGQK
jgi:hypothetical protein